MAFTTYPSGSRANNPLVNSLLSALNLISFFFRDLMVNGIPVDYRLLFSRVRHDVGPRLISQPNFLTPFFFPTHSSPHNSLGRHPQILTPSARNFSLPSTRVQGLASMVSRLTVNAAFEARLLLRPSHQRTVLFGTANKLECPIPGRPTLPPILSRSYSDSTSTSPFPKSSRSTEGSQSSGPDDRNWFHPKGWVKAGAAMVAVGLVCAGSFLCAI